MVLIPFILPHVRYGYLLLHFREGYKKFQLKLGGAVHEDVQRIRLCREILDPDCVLVGDANTGKYVNMWLGTCVRNVE